MSEILLYAHVLTGVVAMAASLNKLVPALEKLQALFWPSVAGVSVSGVGLMFSGVSVARVCVSGVTMTAALVTIHYISERKLAAVEVKE